MASIDNVDTSSDDSGGEEMGPGFGEGTISGEFGASDVAGEGGAGPRVYAWENVGEESEEIAALKRELEEQESLLSEHQSLLSGNEAELETMIKDLRKELHGTQDASWRLDQATELDDMKECLINTVYARAERAAAAAGGDGEAAGAAGDVLPGGAHGASLRELHELNAEMDAELDALMAKLGNVKGQFASLDAERGKLEEELERFSLFEDEEEERLASVPEAFGA
ncbi:hypothetical protein T484DRAFT_1927900 [Baffinella frigidus]|nr:hypothetical protein T484DRAFT_1927900 [Cryptophyta sp. CCMP2293]|mmetsp:Transcript_39218/g.92647  ORF Transcript_39218/g.92647 Transcript_39218/m.92647 type:complete len:226 (-) Transcript_39218:170-847(-)|eukprot:CAMPEP_0180139260 /NCGR_PEP_ID=MMETSP0986-20121125/13422_1 /TAXON_ID=697907 /ORGANISM="non described non described, Strain CCMP2293" /LENGTH=225 /DNA_ID=CAMNT_0022081319 /DNA_START=74 /DNA_END=751 /DNA_ORIENTATION=+